MTTALIHGDCIEVMAGMEPESVDAICTDPPYGLEFMGKEWDKLWDKRESGGFKTGGLGTNIAGRKAIGPSYRGGTSAQTFHATWAEAAYRVAKPSAYLLAFGGTRTVHRMTCALEDAGWIIRDMLVWGYASGFPKSKASLKPAWEPIVMARKPGPLRMLAIDECRIGTSKDVPASLPTNVSAKAMGWGFGPKPSDADGMNPDTGRWPANIILTDPIFDGGIEGVVGGGETTTNSTGMHSLGEYERSGVTGWGSDRERYYAQDSGTYSRFFILPKADRADREPVLKRPGESLGRGRGVDSSIPRANAHPTVKPVDLMRHLVRLVTPTGGTVLDPFLGSGTTALAAEMEGFPWIGIERELEYIQIAEARLNGTQRGLGLPA